MVPNFIMIDRDTPHTSSVLVRGIGSKLQPAVVMYVDGIPHFEKSTFDLSLNDVEQLEFLRGPQGTTLSLIHISTVSMTCFFSRPVFLEISATSSALVISLYIFLVRYKLIGMLINAFPLTINHINGLQRYHF